MPDLDEGVGLEHRHQFLADGHVKRRIPKHFRDIDGQIHEQEFSCAVS